jgi:RNA recognition motif-containing protein
MKLYVGNLPWSIEEEGLKKLFAGYTVAEATIIRDKFSNRSKGFGFITIEDDESAKEAISKLNGKEIEGRELKISEAKPMDAERPPRKNFGSRGPRDFGNKPRRNFSRG